MQVQVSRAGYQPVPGVTLAMASWVPEQLRAVVMVTHGHAEHLDRYVNLIDALAGEGYAVYGQDHRGHGRSSGTRALIMRFDDMVDDLHQLILKAKAAHPGLPVVLFGHSMGGLIAVRYALAHQAELAALAVSGPAMVLDEGVPENKKRIAEAVSRVAPAAPMPREQANHLAVDPEIARRFPEDHLNHHGPTRMRTAVEMMWAGAEALSRVGSLSLPLLVMHGEDDRLTFPSGATALHEGASSTDKTLKFWPGMLHEILNEKDRIDVRSELLTWIGERVG